MKTYRVDILGHIGPIEIQADNDRHLRRLCEAIVREAEGNLPQERLRIKVFHEEDHRERMLK
jgi:hypothetical protein